MKCSPCSICNLTMKSSSLKKTFVYDPQKSDLIMAVDVQVSNLSYWPLFLIECESYKYGPNCSRKCGHCKDGIPCSTVTGACNGGCEYGWIGKQCDTGK